MSDVRLTNARADASESRIVVDGATRRRIREALFNGLAHINLIREIIPASPFRELIDEALRVVADVRGVGHARNLSQKSARRNLGCREAGGESV